MQKLLIADSSEAFVDALREQLQDDFEIMCCSDGRDVVPLLCSYSPDLLLLDLMLPGCDGITILEALHKIKERPVILAISRIFSYYVQDSLERLSVSYAMQKPCDVDLVSKRLRELASYPKSQLLSERDVENTVHSMLSELGFTGNHIGYHCLAEAIRLIAKNPRQLYTKELYPAVGKIIDCNWKQVERDIRTAIESAWESGDVTNWQEYFPNRIRGKAKPTNSVFISTLGQHLNKRLSNHLFTR